MKKNIILLLCFFLLLLSGCSSSTSQKSDEIIKAEKLISADNPHRDLILSEVESGYISASDIELYLFIKEKYDYYDKQDGEYAGDKYSQAIFQEAQDQFNLSKKEVDKKWDTVGTIMIGMKPKEETNLDDNSKPVTISIDKVELSPENELIVTATNSTDIDGSLPTVNMSFQLYNGDQNVGFQIVWGENFKKGTNTFKSFPISDTFDSVDCTAYINIDKMDTFKLKSTVQTSNSKGETIIPVYTMEKIKIK